MYLVIRIKGTSKQFPNILFSLECQGDYGYHTQFWMNGKSCMWEDIMPRSAFPTVLQFKRGVKSKQKKEIAKANQEAKLKREAAEKAKKQEIETLRARLKELENDNK